MPEFPFCVIGDVEEITAQHLTGSAYSGSTKPTSTQVKKFMDERAEHIRAVCVDAGYDIDNFHENSSTVAAAITSGSDKELTVASGEGTNFSAGNDVFITGLKDGARTFEFDYVKSVSGDVVTIKTIDNAYDENTVTLFVVNGALTTLRKTNALGAAAMALEAQYASASPNDSEQEVDLWDRFNGNKKNQFGLWAIKNVPGFLRGATVLSEAVIEATLKSYGSEHSMDDDVEAVITRETNF